MDWLSGDIIANVLTILKEQTLVSLCIQGFLISMVLSLVLVPIVRQQAMAGGLYDKPNERKIHTVPIPRLGGLAIWIAFMMTLWLVSIINDELVVLRDATTGILAGSSIIFMLGLLDDLIGLSPYLKLIVQFIAALVAYYFGVVVMSLDLPESKILLLNFFSIPVTVIWLVGLSNAMNFIDGMDGLASGVTMISALTLVIISFFTLRPTEALLGSILVGSMLGFLAYNFHPAKIFMGDSGSLFSGFMLAALAVTGVFKSKVVVMLLPLFILSVPILDISFAMLRRLFKGKNPFLPDAEHLHHQLLKRGLSQGKAVTLLYLICALGGIVATSYIKSPDIYLTLIGILFAVAFILIALRRKFFPADGVLTADSDKK